MVMMETVIGGITDIFPYHLRRHKTKFVLLCCTIGFLFGIPLTTKVTVFLLNMFLIILYEQTESAFLCFLRLIES